MTIGMRRTLAALGLAALAVGRAGDETPPLDRVGTLTDPALREISGLVASRRHPGIFWAVADSNNPPLLFALRADGRLVATFRVGVANVDWEDVATDDRGNLYIGEIGNNGGRLPLRSIYRVAEPDPAAPTNRPLPVAESSFYRFDADRFDAEALFIRDGEAIVVAKGRDIEGARLFAIPIDPPSSVFRPSRPQPRGRLARFVEPATGGSLTPDGRRLAVCGTNVVRVYEATEAGAWRLVAERKFRGDDQVEAVAWERDDLVLAGERGGIYRIGEDRWRTAIPADR